jgi:hypothetical protein
MCSDHLRNSISYERTLISKWVFCWPTNEMGHLTRVLKWVSSLTRDFYQTYVRRSDFYHCDKYRRIDWKIVEYTIPQLIVPILHDFTVKRFWVYS